MHDVVAVELVHAEVLRQEGIRRSSTDTQAHVGKSIDMYKNRSRSAAQTFDIIDSSTRASSCGRSLDGSTSLPLTQFNGAACKDPSCPDFRLLVNGCPLNAPLAAGCSPAALASSTASPMNASGSLPFSPASVRARQCLRSSSSLAPNAIGISSDLEAGERASKQQLFHAPRIDHGLLHGSRIDQAHLIVPSPRGTIMSEKCEDLFIEALDAKDVEEFVLRAVATWDGDDASSASARTVASRALELCHNCAGGGMLMVIAPDEELNRLAKFSRTADGGYLTRRLRKVHICTNEFKDVFTSFSEHSSTDRWPVDWPDEEARNLTGRILVSTMTQYRLRDGFVEVFGGGAWHRLTEEQPKLPNWANIRQQLEAGLGNPTNDHVEQLDQNEIGEMTDQIKSLFLGEDGRPVSAVQKVVGQPKDGAILMSASGFRLKCAVKLVGLPKACKTWPGVGVRHETSLQVACFLRKAIVLVRSDLGTLHVICVDPSVDASGLCVYRVKEKSKESDQECCAAISSRPYLWRLVYSSSSEDAASQKISI